MSGKVRIARFSMAEHAALLPADWPEGVDLALRIEGDERRLIGVHRDETPEECHRRIAHAEKRPPRHYILTPAEETEALFPVLVESMAETPDLLDLGLEFEMNYDFILSEGLDEAYMNHGAAQADPRVSDGKFIPILSNERLRDVSDGALAVLPEGAAELAFPNGLGTVEIGSEHVFQSIDGTITRVDMSGLDDRDVVPSLMRLPPGSLAFAPGRSRMASRGRFLFIYLDPWGVPAGPPAAGAGPDHRKAKRRLAPWNATVCLVTGGLIGILAALVGGL
ncbi:hypothetical protein [Paracoccus sp. ME4]|uniref:hypothetical protein n=1 Tax=Paracoccus sp. ME4 TaxID=3138066 RepID=UPI00398B5A24